MESSVYALRAYAASLLENGLPYLAAYLKIKERACVLATTINLPSPRLTAASQALVAGFIAIPGLIILLARLVIAFVLAETVASGSYVRFSALVPTWLLYQEYIALATIADEQGYSEQYQLAWPLAIVRCLGWLLILALAHTLGIGRDHHATCNQANLYAQAPNSTAISQSEQQPLVSEERRVQPVTTGVARQPVPIWDMYRRRTLGSAEPRSASGPSDFGADGLVPHLSVVQTLDRLPVVLLRIALVAITYCLDATLRLSYGTSVAVESEILSSANIYHPAPQEPLADPESQSGELREVTTGISSLVTSDQWFGDVDSRHSSYQSVDHNPDDELTAVVVHE